MMTMNMAIHNKEEQREIIVNHIKSPILHRFHLELQEVAISVDLIDSLVYN